MSVLLEPVLRPLVEGLELDRIGPGLEHQGLVEGAGGEVRPVFRLAQDLVAMAADEADPGLHAAAEWVLRTWKQEPWLTTINADWAKDRRRRSNARPKAD